MWQPTPIFLENSMDRRAWKAAAYEVARVEDDWATNMSFKENSLKKWRLKSWEPQLGLDSWLCHVLRMKLGHVISRLWLCASVLSHFSPVRLCANLWTVAHQAPLSTGFSRQEHWSGLLCLPPRDLPDPGIEPRSLKSPAVVGGFFTTSTI